MDGYTTSDITYSQSTGGEVRCRATSTSPQLGEITVDAYQGTVKMYVFDPKDPIIKAWRDAFPNLFTDARRCPRRSGRTCATRKTREGAEHPVRSLHVTEPKRFYDGSQVAGVTRPRVGRDRQRHPLHARHDGVADLHRPQSATSTGKRIDPYYLYCACP